MDALFNAVGDASGASVDQIKLIACLLVSYPLGSVFIRIPASSSFKHIFNLSAALFFLIPVLNLSGGFLQLLGSSLATYFIAKTNTSAKMPWIVFAVAMGHLTVNHVIRSFFSWGYETMDITGPQMVLTMKLTTFAWNVVDGRRPAEDLDKWQLAKRVSKFPSLLEFLGYVFYFPGLLVGPYLDFASYMALVDETLYKTAGAKAENAKRAIPKGRKRVAYRKMAVGLLFLAVYVVFRGHFDPAEALKPWFVSKSLLWRIAYWQLCVFSERTKYYSVWTLTEGASILTGLGFTGFGPNGESLWGGASNVNIWLVEFPSNFKVLLDSWNTNTNIWLRECIYKRVTPKGKKPGFRSSMFTFATSAFWHGIAAGYYMTFISGGFVTTAARLCRANFRPLVLPPPGAPMTMTKRIYDISATFVTAIILNFITAPFLLLNVKDSLELWSRVGWYGIWIIGSTLVFFYAGGAKLCKSMRPSEVPVPEKLPGMPGTPGPHVVPPLEIAAEEMKKQIEATKN
ncbi:MBOAT-domain-containing protein [Coniophora puteana RWD-64-598 SS2]|uniref:MBOAT-domain-containing protein n=1 Tax=Coniophora puteana (strain RWD-64-598) TaxID=741705 RepID=A0A5M3MSP4_CONPW|nr:MBOAT-domain-containing protein [Coniophora puteana RWD-64-598 SS2]EIW82188.1 MBOAT-domain-containing protein [Coniophora puteana RWD-64-598 SS2]